MNIFYFIALARDTLLEYRISIFLLAFSCVGCLVDRGSKFGGLFISDCLFFSHRPVL